MTFARGDAGRANIARIVLVAALALSCGPASDLAPSHTNEGDALTQSPPSSAIPWVAKLGYVGGGGCTVYVLTDHWILGVRHCFDVWASAARFPIIYTSPTGAQEYIYNGPGTVRTYPIGNWRDDIGLLYLADGLGTNLSLTGQAKLYADTRHPWCSYSDPSELVYTIAGYGMGTDVGGSADCSDSVWTEKRINTFVLLTLQCEGTTVWSEYGEAHVCSGDSGGPWLFQRDGEYLAFAHTAWSTGGVLSRSNGGVLIKPYLTWIQDTSAEVDRNHALVLRYGTTAGGYRYGTFVESPRECVVSPWTMDRIEGQLAFPVLDCALFPGIEWPF